MATLHFTPSPTLILPRHNHTTTPSATAFHLKIKPSRLSSPIVRSYKVVIEHEGQTTQLEVEPDETILAKALDTGLSVPHDCKLGVPVGAMPESFEGEYNRLFGDILWEHPHFCTAYTQAETLDRDAPKRIYASFSHLRWLWFSRF
ncbi:hypothetical protein ACJW30_02G014300 [Castanea mollissima]